MPTKFNISGGKTNASAETTRLDKHPRGLVAYTHPLDVYTQKLQLFVDEDGNPNQNVTPTVPSSSVLVHDGTDTVGFTASALVGSSWDFASTAQANSGTKSIDATSNRNGDVASFTSTTKTVSDYDSFDGYVYITSWPSSGSKNFSFQLFLGGVAVGSPVLLSTYVDTSVQDTWQLFTIQMGDFLAPLGSTFDEIRLTTIDAGQGAAPALYFDDMELVIVGESRSVFYTVAPPPGETWVVHRIKWTAVTNSVNLKYDEFFGITALVNGYSLAYESQGSIVNQYFASNFFDMVRFPNVNVTVTGSTHGMFELVMDVNNGDVTLDGDKSQKLVISVRDELSAMLEFQAMAELSVKGIVHDVDI